MNTAPLDPLARRVLRALYELAELDCPASAGLFARAVGIRPADLARVVLALDERGLVRADAASLAPLFLAGAPEGTPRLLARSLEGAPRQVRFDVRLTLLGLAHAVRQPELGLLPTHARGRTSISREPSFVDPRPHALSASRARGASARPRAASPATRGSTRGSTGALRGRTLAG